MPILAAFVLLTLTVWDCDTGTKLEEHTQTFEKAYLDDNIIESCRRWGVSAAHLLSIKYREQGHPNASTNVDCEWRKGSAS